jgi:hypothetical protein
MLNQTSATAPLIGIATSVSAAAGFDPLDTLSYAARHRFPLVQVYLNQCLCDDSTIRRKVVDQAARENISLIAHAPGLLTADDALADDVTHAASEIRYHGDPWVVYHLDEHQALSATLDTLHRLTDRGVVPCIENFHQVSAPSAARAFYEIYLDLFRALSERSMHAVAVLDIPRLYHQNLGLDEHQAQSLTADVLAGIGELKIPLLLHLIDSKSRSLDRADWCPIGQGVIPYAELLKPLARAQFPLRAVVLEYEDKTNPLQSLPFLRQHLADE